MQNGLFKLDLGSVADAVVTAVVVSVVVGFAAAVTTSGFDVFKADWITIGKAMVNLAVISGATSLAKDFITTDAGSVLNITPNSPKVPTV